MGVDWKRGSSCSGAEDAVEVMVVDRKSGLSCLPRGALFAEVEVDPDVETGAASSWLPRGGLFAEVEGDPGWETGAAVVEVEAREGVSRGSCWGSGARGGEGCWGAGEPGPVVVAEGWTVVELLAEGLGSDKSIGIGFVSDVTSLELFGPGRGLGFVLGAVTGKVMGVVERGGGMSVIELVDVDLTRASSSSVSRSSSFASMPASHKEDQPAKLRER